MLNISDKSREFLEKNVPEVLSAKNSREALLILYDFIDEYGFESPEYYDYNELGVEAQKVYDDIYCNNGWLKMKIDLFDVVILKNGQEGAIVDILANGKAYVVDVEISDNEYDQLIVKKEDITRVIWKMKNKI